MRVEGDRGRPYLWTDAILGVRLSVVGRAEQTSVRPHPRRTGGPRVERIGGWKSGFMCAGKMAGVVIRSELNDHTNVRMCVYEHV